MTRTARAGTDATDWLDRAALGASVACMVHCLALPLLLAALPALTTILAIPESFHLWVLAAAAPMAGVALIQGHGRHARRWPVALGIAGLAVMAAGALILRETPGETILTVAGSLALAAAHVANWRLRHACRRLEV